MPLTDEQQLQQLREQEFNRINAEGARNPPPVPPKPPKIFEVTEQFDNLCNVAYRHGFDDCQLLRAVPANKALLKPSTLRGSGTLKKGNRVVIPEFQVKKEAGSTEKRHAFVVRRGNLASIRFVHSPNPPNGEAPSLRNLDVSNYITNKAGTGDGTVPFPGEGVRAFHVEADKDSDAFQVEVFDLFSTKKDLKAELEVMLPEYNSGGDVIGYKPFPAGILADRQIKALTVSKSIKNRFRSCYLRLVVDKKDKDAAKEQTLLVADLHDQHYPQVEILDQVVRASYEIPSCKANPKCRAIEILPIGTDRRRLKIAVHILRKTVGGSPVVSIADADRRINRWLRRMYAQMSIAPKMVQRTHAVDLPENLIAISDNTGAKAIGNEVFSFRITGGGSTQVVGPYTPDAGDPPSETALALALLVKPPFTVEVSINPPIFGARSPSADLIIKHNAGKTVKVDKEKTSALGQTLTVAKPKAKKFKEWDGTNWLVGTAEQRAVLKNYAEDDRMDIFIVESFVSNTLLGAAMMSGHIVDPARSAIEKVRWSAFVELKSSDGSDKFANVIPHEVMHCVGEVMHAQGAPQQIMHPFASEDNTVDSVKRVRDGDVTYDGNKIAGNHNLVLRMRVQGKSLLENW